MNEKLKQLIEKSNITDMSGTEIALQAFSLGQQDMREKAEKICDKEKTKLLKIKASEGRDEEIISKMSVLNFVKSQIQKAE